MNVLQRLLATIFGPFADGYTSVEELHRCRTTLHANGLLDDDEDDDLKRRIDQMEGRQCAS
jgi:hypothetical protein